MKSLLVPLCVLVMCGSAHADSRRVTDPAPFETVTAAGIFHVEVAQGPVRAVSLDGSPEDIERIRLSIHDGIVEVKQRCTFGCNRRLDVVVRVTSPHITRLNAVKGASIVASGLDAENIEVNAAMGGSVRATGTCGRLDAAAAMGGAIEADTLRCRDVDINAAMGGTAHVFASESADADAAMGGAVQIDGSPNLRHSTGVMGGAVSFR